MVDGSLDWSHDPIQLSSKNGIRYSPLGNTSQWRPRKRVSRICMKKAPYAC